MTFGERLRELREAAVMSRQELATASGLVVGSIQGYEQDRRTPGIRIIGPLCFALGITPDTLFAGVNFIKEHSRRRRGRPSKRKAT